MYVVSSGADFSRINKINAKKKTDALAEEKTTMQKKKGYPAYLPRGSVFLFYRVCTIVKEHSRYGNVALPNNSVQCCVTEFILVADRLTVATALWRCNPIKS